ncbi:hypothetical protein DR996_07245 [Vibrio owensii]|nr:hypothetical protein DR996_07245 [Vibrio owensii]
MKKSNKSLISNSLFLNAKTLVVLIVTLYTSRILLNEMGVVDFGLYNVIGGVVATLSFLTSSMALATQRFVAYDLGKNDHSRIKNIYSTSLNIYISIIVLIFLFGVTVGKWFVSEKLSIPIDRYDAAVNVYYVTIVTFSLSVLCIPFNAFLISYEKFKLITVIGIIEVMLKLLLIISMEFFDCDKMIYYSIIMLIVSMSVFLMNYLCFRISIQGVNYSISFDLELTRKMLSYTGWNLLGNVSWVAFSQGTNILINVFFGPSVNASRAIAYQVTSALNNFSKSITTAINPQIVKKHSSGNSSSAEILILNGAKYSFFFIFLLSAPIIMNIEFVLKFWLGQVPDYAAIFCLFVIVDANILALSSTLTAGVQATGKVKYFQIFESIFTLMNIPVSYYFLFNGAEAQVVFVVMIFFSLILLSSRLLFAKYLIDLSLSKFLGQVISKSILVVTISSVFASTMGIFGSASFFEFIVKSMIVSFLIIITIYFFGLDKKEKVMFKNILNGFLGKFYSYVTK